MSALVALGIALLTAGALARLGRRVGLPTIPLFMLAGMIFGPHTPGLDIVSEPEVFELVAVFGLVFLLFSLGLEFSVDDLVGGGRRLLLAGGAYLLLNVGAGLAFGFALGWGSREALVVAGALGISSSAIVTKLLIELGRVGNPESKLVLGIIVVEDLFLALYLAALQPVFTETQGLGSAVASIAKGFGFLLVLAVVARHGARWVGRALRTDDDELLTIGSVGFALLVAGVAGELGVSDAIGALMAGLILAESPSSDRIRRLVHPLRDTFAAMFFFTFGLNVEPDAVASLAGPIALAVAMSVGANLLAGWLAGRLWGLDFERAVTVGCTVLARGEFSLILASLAVAAGLDERIGPFVAGYVFVLAVAAPILAAQSRVITRLLRACLRPVAASRR